MTKYAAHRKAHELWGSNDHVGMICLRRKHVPNRCEVGYYVRTTCAPWIRMGAGPTWEAAFIAASRAEKGPA
jgi:hypothetical protein